MSDDFRPAANSATSKQIKELQYNSHVAMVAKDCTRFADILSKTDNQPADVASIIAMMIGDAVIASTDMPVFEHPEVIFWYDVVAYLRQGEI